MDEKMTVADAGRLGGATTKKRYGAQYFGEIGRKGGERLLEKYGHDHFVEIGRKGGEKTRRMVEAGRAALEGRQ